MIPLLNQEIENHCERSCGNFIWGNSWPLDLNIVGVWYGKSTASQTVSVHGAQNIF